MDVVADLVFRGLGANVGHLVGVPGAGDVDAMDSTERRRFEDQEGVARIHTGTGKGVLISDRRCRVQEMHEPAQLAAYNRRDGTNENG
jgi:hypothetical protein